MRFASANLHIAKMNQFNRAASPVINDIIKLKTELKNLYSLEEELNDKKYHDDIRDNEKFRLLKQKENLLFAQMQDNIRREENELRLSYLRRARQGITDYFYPERTNVVRPEMIKIKRIKEAQLRIANKKTILIDKIIVTQRKIRLVSTLLEKNIKQLKVIEKRFEINNTVSKGRVREPWEVRQ